DPGVTPTPVSGTLIEGFVASLVTLRLPLAVPALVGAKLIEKFWICPGASVNGRAIPPRLKPFPLTTPCLILTVPEVELVRAAVCDWVEPTCTLPRLTVLGVTVN